ncbi:MAG: MFS transporter [Solirubrobacterales bacterium]|nr:MFS transporter [Solirubrobacterales bacterium]
MRPTNGHRPLMLLAALFLASLTLRPQLVGIGPLLSAIRRSLGVSHSVAGLLSTVVLLCMGVFAPMAFVIARRAGTRWTIAGALTLIAGFGMARVLTKPPAAVILLTLPIGIGIAVAGSLMPLVVRESWSRRPVLGTSAYTTGIGLGAAVAAAVAVPLEHAFGSWRDSLAAFSLFTAAMVVVWIALTRGYGGRAVAAAGSLPRLPLRMGVAWLLVALFALVSITYYGVNAWLPSSFTERGWSHASAGALLTVVNAVTVPVGVFLAFRGDVFGSRRFWLGAGAISQLAGLLGVILAPDAGWAWAVLIGGGIGLLFPSLMLMPLDVADRPADVGAMAALMLGAGYTLSSAGPALLGLARDAAGSFTLAIWLMVAVTALVLGIALLISNERLRRHPRARAAPEPAEPVASVN